MPVLRYKLARKDRQRSAPAGLIMQLGLIKYLPYKKSANCATRGGLRFDAKTYRPHTITQQYMHMRMASRLYENSRC